MGLLIFAVFLPPLIASDSTNACFLPVCRSWIQRECDAAPVERFYEFDQKYTAKVIVPYVKQRQLRK